MAVCLMRRTLRAQYRHSSRSARMNTAGSAVFYLSSCLRARRQEFPQPEGWQPGQTKMFTLRSTDRSSYASQTFIFKRQ